MTETYSIELGITENGRTEKVGYNVSKEQYNKIADLLEMKWEICPSIIE